MSWLDDMNAVALELAHHMARLHGYTGPVKLTLSTGTGPVEHDILPTCVVCNRQDGQHEDYCISAPEEDQ